MSDSTKTTAQNAVHLLSATEEVVKVPHSNTPIHIETSMDGDVPGSIARYDVEEACDETKAELSDGERSGSNDLKIALPIHEQSIVEDVECSEGEECGPNDLKAAHVIGCNGESQSIDEDVVCDETKAELSEGEESRSDMKTIVPIDRQVLDPILKLKVSLRAILANLREGNLTEESLPSSVRQLYQDLSSILSHVNLHRLPWSAIRNIINTEAERIGYRLSGSLSCHATKIDLKVLESVVANSLDSITKWCPDYTAIGETCQVPISNMFALASTESTEEKSIEDFESMWPVNYPDGDVQLILPDDFPRRVYKSRNDKDKWNHWGQRKLMMNEIEFLTIYAAEGDTLVYAGAAPSQHTKFLSEIMFPSINFVLVDPAPFAISESDKIKIINGLFTDEIAQSYSGRNDMLFMSDIRRTYASEELIWEDMTDQQRWHEIIKPKASHFKFRLPWADTLTDYLDGVVYIQPYAKAQSTETRLVATSCEHKNWNNKQYEQQCYYFNTIHRRRKHSHGVKGAGLDAQSYDAAAEVEILRAFFSRIGGEAFTRLERAEQNKEIAILSIRITESIGGEIARQYLRRADRRLLHERSAFIDYYPGRKTASSSSSSSSLSHNRHSDNTTTSSQSVSHIPRSVTKTCSRESTCASTSPSEVQSSGSAVSRNDSVIHPRSLSALEWENMYKYKGSCGSDHKWKVQDRSNNHSRNRKRKFEEYSTDFSHRHKRKLDTNYSSSLKTRR